MKATLTILGAILELEAKSDKELWQKMAFYQSLPTTCPIDDTPTRFGFRSPKGNDYYEVCNTNQHYYITFHIGQNKEGGTLYADGTWTWWDWKNKEEILLANWSTLTEDGEQLRQQILQGKPKAPRKQEPTEEGTPATHTPVAVKSDALVALRRVFHALGTALSQEAIAAGNSQNQDASNLWETRRAEIVQLAGRRRKPAAKLESSDDLTADELRHYIAALETKCREKIYEWADKLDLEASDLDNLLPDNGREENDGIESVFGVALAKVLNTLTKPKTKA